VTSLSFFASFLRAFFQGDLSIEEAAMQKRNLQKAAVLLVCFAFLGLSGSRLSANQAKATRISFSILLKYPAQFLANLFPGLRNIIKVERPNHVQPNVNCPAITIKPAGAVRSVRLSGGD